MTRFKKHVLTPKQGKSHLAGGGSEGMKLLKIRKSFPVNLSFTSLIAGERKEHFFLPTSLIRKAQEDL